MSYDVHITRAPDWSESETVAIALEEWIVYARSDPELRVDVVDGRTESTLPSGEILSVKVERPRSLARPREPASKGPRLVLLCER